MLPKLLPNNDASKVYMYGLFKYWNKLYLIVDCLSGNNLKVEFLMLISLFNYDATKGNYFEIKYSLSGFP